MSRAGSVLLVAVAGWVAGFWWCRGRWEQGLWFAWVLLPVLAWNWRRVFILWWGWIVRYDWWWILFWAVVEWQFWIAGFRAGHWWDGPGGARDALALAVIVTGLVLAGRKAEGREWLWRVVAGVGALAVAVSLVMFYLRIGLDEERFRLCWRGWPGFNAVTTGILAGMALIAGLGGNERGRSPWLEIPLLVLGFGLAASESRGALLAVIAAVCWWTWLNRSRWRRLIAPAAGFFLYWILVVLLADGGSGGMVERGSAGRLDIYRSYLGDISGWQWLFGRGEVPQLPEERLGWLVHHTHSAYLGQLVGFGAVGLVLLLGALGWGLWRIRSRREAPLLVFGLVAILFDGGMVFSLQAIARWEVLVVLVPLTVGMASVGGRENAA